ncbi:hypothetical protein ACF3OC_09350 [Sphingobacterium cellulitidis]|uniref:hypothetical protein n=1 Tax=Sphingobacterium cellulitidis TaxID=1768011 RepID=UPI00370D5986
MKSGYLLCFVLGLLIFGCGTPRRNVVKQNQATEEQTNMLLQWYDDLVKEKPLPIYVFETEVINKTSAIIPDYEYILIDPTWCFDEDRCPFQVDKELINKAKKILITTFGENYDSLFLQPETAKAYSFLESNKLGYHSVFLQVPVVRGEANIDSILQASYLLVPKLPSPISDEQFRKIYKTSYDKNDSINRVENHFLFNREKVKDYLFRRYYAHPFDNISELVESDHFNPNFKSSDLPGPLIDSLFKRFEYLKLLIPDSLKSKTINSTLKLGYINEVFEAPKLYFRNDGLNVFISPLLIRAAIINGLSESFLRVENVKGFKNPAIFSVKLIENYKDIVGKTFEPRRNNRKSVLTMEMEIFYPSIQERWRSQFDFSILHEFGHIVNEKFSEEQCDCFAINILKQNFSKVDLGVFSNLVVTYKGEYWRGINDKASNNVLRKRQERAIEMINTPGIIDCTKIF